MDPADGIDFEIFRKVDVRVGVIRSVAEAEGCRVPAYRLEIDFGPEIGIRRSIAQAKNYPPEALLGKQILAVVNLRPRQVGRHVSEVLVLGVPTADRGTALIIPDMPATTGGRLF
jgi:tRNA-binding protein